MQVEGAVLSVEDWQKTIEEVGGRGWKISSRRDASATIMSRWQHCEQKTAKRRLSSPCRQPSCARCRIHEANKSKVL